MAFLLQFSWQLPSEKEFYFGEMDFILKSVTRSSDPQPTADLKTRNSSVLHKRTSVKEKRISKGKSQESSGWFYRETINDLSNNFYSKNQ